MLKINSFYSLLLAFLTIAALSAGIWVVYNLDPTAGPNVIILFYTLTGIFILCLTALVFYLFKQRFGMREEARKHFMTSLRQGSWMALVYIIGLYLQAQGLFTWLNSGLLLAAFFFLESYFLYTDRKKIN